MKASAFGMSFTVFAYTLDKKEECLKRLYGVNITI